MAKRPRGRPPYEDVLTPAEWQIAHAIRHGMTNRDIAQRRGISPDAVKFHVANVLAKLQLPDRVALRKSWQVPKGSALGRQELPAMTPVSLGPIGQIARSVSNIEAAARWYGQVLGLEHLYTFGKLAFFDCGGTRLLLSEQSAGSGDSILYFRVDSIQASYEHLQQQGVQFTHAPHLIHKHADGTEEWMAFFQDPDGKALAIMTQVRP